MQNRTGDDFVAQRPEQLTDEQWADIKAKTIARLDELVDQAQAGSS